jgi:hypothetical protein
MLSWLPGKIKLNLKETDSGSSTQEVFLLRVELFIEWNHGMQVIGEGEAVKHTRIAGLKEGKIDACSICLALGLQR